MGVRADGESVFPPRVLSSLNPSDLELLVMLCVESPEHNGGVIQCCFLEASKEDLATFLECMRIFAFSKEQRQSMGILKLSTLQRLGQKFEVVRPVLVHLWTCRRKILCLDSCHV